MSTSSGIVVVDTGVFSASLSPRRDHVEELYADDLAGKRLLISFQTSAEIRYGALKARWQTKRLELMEQRLQSALEIPPHADLTRAWAELRNECRRAGHAFHDRTHTADLWTAATAKVANAPLVTHDAGFREIPGIDIICRV